MRTLRLACTVLLTALAPAAMAAPSAADLAARMREARLTPGFEARLQAVEVAPDGQRSEPIKLAIVGQVDAARRRLLVRGIAPETIRGDIRLADYRAGCVRALDRNGTADPQAPLFGTGLVVWDMLAPWWDWPQQSLAGKDRIAGRDCVIVRSRNEPTNVTRSAPIAEVRSCVDADGGLSLRTQFFDGQGARLRSITVVATLRKESGLLGAKKVVIAAGDKITEAEAYSGDEHYEVPADAFAKLEGMATCR